MNPYAIIPLACFLALVVVGCYIYAKNPRTNVSRIFLVFAGFSAYWSFIEFGYRNSLTYEQAVFWAKVGFLRPLAVAFIAHFILVYTSKPHRVQWKILHFAIYLPGSIFAALDLFFCGVCGTPTLHYWGWGLGPSPFPLIQYAYITWGGLCALFLILVVWRHHGREKVVSAKQANAFFVSMTSLLTLGLLTLILDRLTHVLPEMTTLVGTSITIAFAYQVNRLGLFQLTPQTAVEHILAIMPDSLILAGPSNEVLRVNKAILDLTGYRAEEMITLKLQDLFEADAVEKLGGRSDGAQKTTEIVTTLKTRTAERIPFLLRAATIAGPDGTPFGQVVIGHDLRIRKQTEEGLRRAERLESLEVIAGGVAHDFNNLLTAILANLSLARSAEGSLAKNEKIEIAEKASYAAAELTRQLLSLSRKQNPKREEFLIQDIIQEAVALSLSGTNVVGAVSIADGLLPVEADRYQILQVLLNLLINARQAMPNGGTVRIAAKNLQAETDADNASVEIQITDSGGGVPQDVLPHIFDPFFTTKSKGSGLGLAIAQSVINQHGGAISVASEKGIGTTFSIRLPASRESTSPIERNESPARKHTGRILVMDDDDMVRSALAELLDYMGFEVIHARDGAEAIEIYLRFQNEGQPFHTVILDLTVTTGYGGKDTIARLRQINPQVKAIIMSGNPHDDVVQNHLAYGFLGCLAKPFTGEELSRLFDDIPGVDLSAPSN